MNNNDNKQTEINITESKNDCYTDRKTFAVLTNKSGEIFMIDQINYGIRIKDDAKPLLPCNLPVSLQ